MLGTEAISPVSHSRLLLLATILVLLSAGCLEEDFPGESIGTYDVTETLSEDTCSVAGGATAALSELSFSVELRRETSVEGEEETVGYWRRIGQPIIEGTVNGEGTYTIELAVNETYPTDGSLGTGGANAGTSNANPDAFSEEAITEQDLDRISGVDGSNANNGGVQGTNGNCTLTRTELLEVTPEGEALNGTHQIDYNPIQGPCNLIVGTTFQTLPCRILYDIEADAFTPPEPKTE